VVQKIFCRILGCALLSYGGTAFAFTLITLQEPSNTVTDTFTLQAQVQPIAGTIRAQLFGLRRAGGSRKVTQTGGWVVAANDDTGSRRDFNYLAASNDSPRADGASGGEGKSESVWISSVSDSLENTFTGTAFYGMTQNVLVGYDLTRSERYVFGVSGGYEASHFVTQFNSGNEKTDGYNLNPYFAWLISDAWTLDLIGGYGKFSTDQSRTVGTGLLTTTAVDSHFSSNRSFVSANLTNISGWSNWKLTTSLGYLWSRRDLDGYTENGGLPVAESKQTAKQANLLEEISYGRGNSETFFGARYEAVQNYQKIQLAAAEQPANDPNSVLLTAGWRYFGRGFAANFVFSARAGQEQVKEHGFSMVLRTDL
jgi:hypothetical protein